MGQRCPPVPAELSEDLAIVQMLVGKGESKESIQD